MTYLIEKTLLINIPQTILQGDGQCHMYYTGALFVPMVISVL